MLFPKPLFFKPLFCCVSGSGSSSCRFIFIPAMNWQRRADWADKVRQIWTLRYRKFRRDTTLEKTDGNFSFTKKDKRTKLTFLLLWSRAGAALSIDLLGGVIGGQWPPPIFRRPPVAPRSAADGAYCTHTSLAPSNVSINPQLISNAYLSVERIQHSTSGQVKSHRLPTRNKTHIMRENSPTRSACVAHFSSVPKQFRLRFWTETSFRLLRRRFSLCQRCLRLPSLLKKANFTSRVSSQGCRRGRAKLRHAG